jgi:hypothetical protein
VVLIHGCRFSSPATPARTLIRPLDEDLFR